MSDDDIITDLNEETFLPFLKNKRHVLVMFMSPYCPHCKKTKPEYRKAAESFKKNHNVSFTQVDCTENEELCRENGIEAFPLIKYFNYRRQIEETYEGKRNAEGIIAFVQKFKPDE